MRSTRCHLHVSTFSLLALALGVSAGCSSGSGDTVESSTPSALSADEQALAAIPAHATRSVCASDPGAGKPRCLAVQVTDLPDDYVPDLDENVEDDATTDGGPPARVGHGPASIQSAYAIPDGGEGITVGIVDAYDDPEAEADLAVYRQKYNLPPCTTVNGCFRKVDMNGGTDYPAPDYSWTLEISEDLDAVSAACPKCKILLVEEDDTKVAAGDSIEGTGIAVDTAVKLGATFVSNSYVFSEVGDATWATQIQEAAVHYLHPGVAIFAGSGDYGFGTATSAIGGPGFPADIPQVFAVGGTSLAKSTSPRGWAEQVWGSPGGFSRGGGSFCSEVFPKPSYQRQTACKGRMAADLAALADPAVGLNVYVTYVDPTQSLKPGWTVFGGTSLATPLTAAIFAASGRVGATPALPYGDPEAFNDITSGSNGTCKSKILCNAEAGYDGPTGIGTPIGRLLASR